MPSWLLTPIPTATVSVFGCAQSVTSRMAPAELEQVHQCDNTSPPASLQDTAEPSHPSQTRASVGQQQCPSCHRNLPSTARGTQSLLSHLSVLHIARCDPSPSPAFLRSVSRWICAACRRLRPTRLSGQPCKTCGAREHPEKPLPALLCPFAACVASQSSFPQWSSPEGLINHINNFHLTRGESPNQEFLDSIGCSICRSCSILIFRSGCPSCRGRSPKYPKYPLHAAVRCLRQHHTLPSQPPQARRPKACCHGN